MSYEEQELLECTKCGIQVEQILALQCDHNICLYCSSKIVNKWSKRYDLNNYNPPMKCEICGECTMLDPSAIQVLLQMHQSQSFHDQENPLNYNDVMITFTKLLYQGTLPDTKQSMQPIEEPFRSTQNRNEILVQQQQEDRQVERQLDRSMERQTNNVSHREENTSCKQHIGESAILYCFTCEGGCFCMECYLQGLHKNHEVKNVQKSLKQLKEIKVDNIWYSIKQSQESLLNDQCKLTNKKRELVDLGAQGKLQIQQNFEQLYRILQQKEKELISATDEMVQDKMKELDEQLDQITKLNDKLQQYQNELTMHFPDDNKLGVNQSIQAFNYVAQNNKKIDNTVKQMHELKKQTNSTIQANFQLDSQSVQQFLEDIKGLKIKVTSLRGMENNEVSERERILYEKAKEDRSKRLFQGIMNQESPKSKLSFDVSQQSVNQNESKENLQYMDNLSHDNSLLDFSKRFKEVKRMLESKNK